MRISRNLGILLTMLVIFTALTGCGGETPSGASGTPQELTVFAAASLTSPLDELIAAYEAAHSGVKVTAIYGGSGTLQTQLEEGAPADLFISAAPKQMDVLEQKSLIDASTRVDLLTNEIVLIVPAGQPVMVGSFGDVALDAVSKIALGDPGSVPVGQYSQEVFTSLDLWDKISLKATYASDVKQVLSWVVSGNVDCGVVYMTDAIADNGVKVIAEAPYDSHSPIVYPAAVIKDSANGKTAADFLKYLQSADGSAVFTKYGFTAA
jgi:molybdate transport system substrate-binding protein